MHKVKGMVTPQIMIKITKYNPRPSRKSKSRRTECKQSQSVKLDQVYRHYEQGLSIGNMKRCPKVSTMVGSSNECKIVLKLLDTGSCVSTLCQPFYDKYLKDIPLLPVEDILKYQWRIFTYINVIVMCTIYVTPLMA